MPYHGRVPDALEGGHEAGMTMDEKAGRESSRFLAGLQGILHLDGGDPSCEAFNLSRSGVLLRGAPELPIGREVRLTLKSGSGDLALTVDGRVVRVADPLDEGERSMGVEFVAIAEADRPTLEALIARVVEGVAPASLQSVSPQSSVAEIRRALEAISLGHRIALAARAMPREREILIHDPQLQVIDALARNPNLLPNEVRSLLRNKSLLPHTLDAIARDQRWRTDEAVQVMIATHPNVSLTLAQRLVDSLGPSGKRKVLQSSGLKSALRARLIKKH
jgi:hypothetical protein